MYLRSWAGCVKGKGKERRHRREVTAEGVDRGSYSTVQYRDAIRCDMYRTVG